MMTLLEYRHGNASVCPTDVSLYANDLSVDILRTVNKKRNWLMS